MEVIGKSIEYKRFVNRGFLIGPYCPIYGWGAVMITFLLYRFSFNPLILFIMVILVCSILEYMTSFIMEKMFKARWWDYSKRKFNLNGRICVNTMIPFGIFGVFITYVTNPFFIGVLENFQDYILNDVAIILLIIFAIDNIISFIVVSGLRKATMLVNSQAPEDNTEAITMKVREILTDKSWMHRRIINAYPRLVAIKQKIDKIKQDVKETANEVKENINEKKENVKTAINGKKEEIQGNIETVAKKMANEVQYRKKRVKVKIHLGKRKMTQNFKKSK